MIKMRTREHLSVFEAQTFGFALLMLVSMDSAQVHGDRWWRIPDFSREYSTPRRDNRPAATPMMNRGSLNKWWHKLFIFLYLLSVCLSVVILKVIIYLPEQRVAGYKQLYPSIPNVDQQHQGQRLHLGHDNVCTAHSAAKYKSKSPCKVNWRRVKSFVCMVQESHYPTWYIVTMVTTSLSELNDWRARRMNGKSM